jgi:hypothetical protein
MLLAPFLWLIFTSGSYLPLAPLYLWRGLAYYLWRKRLPYLYHLPSINLEGVGWVERRYYILYLFYF